MKQKSIRMKVYSLNYCKIYFKMLIQTFLKNILFIFFKCEGVVSKGVSLEI